MPKATHFDLNLLRVFLSVYKSRSYTTTAEELDLTPSAVSHAIKRLNNQLGETLFQRKHVGVEATYVAHDLFKQVSAPFYAIERTILGYEDFSATETDRTFRVFVPDVYMSDLIMRLAEKNKGGAQVICVALPPDQDETYDALASGEVDLVVDFVAPHLGGVASILAHQEPMVCVVNENHPRIGDTISYDEYFSESHAFLNLLRFNSRAADTLAKQPIPQRKIHSEHNSLYSMLHTIAHTDAIGICTKNAAIRIQEALPVKIMDVPYEINKVALWVNWPKKLDNNPANQWLRSLVIELLAQA
ncbi:LysR family transcriptional regulator [Vibrio scophthalmi]|uniref:LysR family transcriptional regulator n=1 Tax=Vibrio scophthalmi TaxID=45658 RepID=UPI002FEF4121